jgi:hypothetical protein
MLLSPTGSPRAHAHALNLAALRGEGRQAGPNTILSGTRIPQTVDIRTSVTQESLDSRIYLSVNTYFAGGS